LKILFIVPATGYYRSALSNPLGVLSIATYLKKNGYDVKIFDRNVERINIDKLIKSYNPDIIGVSIMSSRCLKDALKVSKDVKRYGKMVVWGGQIPTMNTELCFSCEYVNYVMMGEGEITWLEFARKIENSESPDKIDGIAYKENGQIVITKCRDFADLKELPLIDWSIVKRDDFVEGATDDNAIGALSWALVLAWNEDRLPKGAAPPKTWRALYCTPSRSNPSRVSRWTPCCPSR